MRTKPSSTGKKPDRTRIGWRPPQKPDFPIKRILIGLDRVNIYGWPSRGGFIVLSHATRPDFDFLGWDVVSPPMKRDKDQDAEDRLCQKLLLLGANWFDSRERYRSVVGVAEGIDPVCDTVDADGLSPSMAKRSWIKVGWPSNGEGLWVAEYDDPKFGISPWPERRGEGVYEAGQLALAGNMDEKCEILKRLGGRFFARLEDYDGMGCLRAWEEKSTGEFGPLVVTRYVEW